MRKFPVLILTLLLFLLTTVACEKQNVTSKNDTNTDTSEYKYEIENNCTKIISHSYNPEEKQIRIPEKLGGYPVTVLGKDSFYQHTNTTSITLPESLKEINGSPFYRCYSLDKIFIPQNVEKIDSNPFFRCSSLTKITVDSDNPLFSDSDGVLFDKNKSILISYPEGKKEESYTVPKTVKELKSDSFGYNSKLKKITLYKSLTKFPEDNMFVFPDNIILLVESDSAAQRYAIKHSLNYEIIETGTNKETLTEKLIREIDDAYHKEAELPEFSTTVGMIELADKYAGKWKQIADEYYNILIKNDNLHTYILNMKNNWEEYYQTQCENYIEILHSIYDHGTIIGPIFAHYKYELQKDWALRLVEIYEQSHIE